MSCDYRHTISMNGRPDVPHVQIISRWCISRWETAGFAENIAHHCADEKDKPHYTRTLKGEIQCCNCGQLAPKEVLDTLILIGWGPK